MKFRRKPDYLWNTLIFGIPPFGKLQICDRFVIKLCRFCNFFFFHVVHLIPYILTWSMQIFEIVNRNQSRFELFLFKPAIQWYLTFSNIQLRFFGPTTWVPVILWKIFTQRILCWQQISVRDLICYRKACSWGQHNLMYNESCIKPRSNGISSHQHALPLPAQLPLSLKVVKI